MDPLTSAFTDGLYIYDQKGAVVAKCVHDGISGSPYAEILAAAPRLRAALEAILKQPDASGAVLNLAREALEGLS